MSVNLYNVGIEEWHQILALFVGCHKYHIIHWPKVLSVHPSQYSDLIIKILTFVCHAAGVIKVKWNINIYILFNKYTHHSPFLKFIIHVSGNISSGKFIINTMT